MRDASATPTGDHSDSYTRLAAKVIVLLLALLGIGLFGLPRAPRHQARPTPPVPLAVKPQPSDEEPAPTPPPAPVLDRAAVAQAEASLQGAQRERVRSEARLAEASARLAAASTESGRETSAARSLAGRVRDPSARIASANARLLRLKAERDQLKADLVALDGTPKPRAKPLIDKSPVAKPTDGEEYHFEVRGNRVTFIDLDRLLERVKTDARLRIRLGGGVGTIVGEVGPVGAFSLHYEMDRAGADPLSEMLGARGAAGATYNLQAWEIVPQQTGRGESFEMTRQPASDFARAINRLSPGHATITMWIYPDGFALYRKLRDALHERGYLVAARPLPEGMAIRGSTSGSRSAGQ